MVKKKAIVVIVEGTTDQMVLEPLNNLIDNHRFKIKVIGGDSYTEMINQNIPPKNIIGNIMKAVMEETKFRQQDIALVLQLVDTDGAFISESSFTINDKTKVIEGKSYSYDFSKKEVQLLNDGARLALIQRWHQKGNHLRALCQGVEYSRLNIPYYLFFNSLNLEHVISNQILEDAEKDNAALQFLEQIDYNHESLEDFFKSKCPYSSYDQSWQEIFEDDGWDQSKSNIPFLIDLIKETDQNPNDD